jgi:hypothetical protein
LVTADETLDYFFGSDQNVSVPIIFWTPNARNPIISKK